MEKQKDALESGLVKFEGLVQVGYKGKTNTHSHSQGLYLFINYELHATLNDLNWRFSKL